LEAQGKLYQTVKAFTGVREVYDAEAALGAAPQRAGFR
jgi:hypothetical protein